ncbi:MAG: DEAD/DEAH box helicase, partial [Lysobacterales bacterium]
HQAIQELGKHTRVRSITVYGGVSKNPQIQALKNNAEIVVACPGRLLDLHSEGYVDLTHVEVLVLDEADRMCDMGFLPDIRRILKLVPSQRQTLFFSATMPPDIRRLADSILKNPATIQIGMIEPAKTVSHALYPVERHLKKDLLLAMLNQMAIGRTLVFTRTKHRAKNLARDLVKENLRAAALQGNMSQNQRQGALDGFRGGKYDILVATDVAARGIDVSEISHVINYDMPDTVDAYTHRIGRTGRAEETGVAFTFVERDDEDLVRQVEKLLGYRIEREYVEGFNYNVAAPPRQDNHNPRQSPGRNHAFPNSGNRGSFNRGSVGRGVPNRTNSNRRSGTR